jgi:hypothetical protein
VTWTILDSHGVSEDTEVQVVTRVPARLVTLSVDSSRDVWRVMTANVRRIGS